MFRNDSLIVEEQRIVDEREVEGLIMICKEMATQDHIEKMALMAIPFDENVVREAKRRILGL
ncbi:hypothetical protein H6775_01055 [Candidatus Nomurabacteria bacterium]|nr:hypothetical protein [Candidatus Nomurabacteria bacterium]